MSEDTKQVYEVGYHVVPLIAETDIPKQAEEVRGVIAGQEGSFLSEGEPKAVTLAYSIEKEYAGEKKTFDSAYFGWIKFELNPANLEAIKKALDAKDEILRYILIKTVPGDTRISKKTRHSSVREEDEGEVSEEELAEKLAEIVPGEEEVVPTVETTVEDTKEE